MSAQFLKRNIANNHLYCINNIFITSYEGNYINFEQKIRSRGNYNMNIMTNERYV